MEKGRKCRLDVVGNPRSDYLLDKLAKDANISIEEALGWVIDLGFGQLNRMIRIVEEESKEP